MIWLHYFTNWSKRALLLAYRVLLSMNQYFFLKNPDLQTDLNLTGNYKCVFSYALLEGF